MSSILFKTFFLVLFVVNAFAQDLNLPLELNSEQKGSKSVVYKTFSDYKSNKLSYEIDCKTEKHAIRLNEFFNESYITIKYKGVKIKFKKDSTYAILNCDEPLIRFQNKEHFYLAEKGGVWIFYKEISVIQSKGLKMEKQYYFSRKGDGKIIELTIDNVKQAFPDNHPLHDAISSQFQNADISEYDTFHRMFKINHIINTTK